MSAVASGDAVESALAKMRAMLEADGYELAISAHDGGVTLTVRPTAQACAECLVPKSLLASMAADMLAKGGVQAAPSDLRVIYPGER